MRVLLSHLNFPKYFIQVVHSGLEVLPHLWWRSNGASLSSLAESV